MPNLVRLTVLVPERHDLALMKTVRGDLADFEKLQALPGGRGSRQEGVRTTGPAKPAR
jgi:hypothetical protein